jgi:hypothetical protein
MRTNQLNAAVAAGNPLPRRTLAALDLGDGGRELLAEIATEPLPGGAGATSAPPALGQRRRRRGVLVLLASAAAITALILVALGTAGGPSEGPASAYGAQLVRFAEASPLLLLEAPGWHVQYADEESAREGQLQFVRGAPIPPEHVTESVVTGKVTGMNPPAVRQRQAELSWRRGPLQGWLVDRAASADLTTTAPVLDTTARVYRYEGGSSGERDITALWNEDGRVLEFRAAVPDMEAFRERLDGLRHVGANAWLDAMPASVVKAADHGSTVSEMLKGVPLPAGFDPAQIPDAGLTTARYQLGAAVAGTVACSWFRQWGEGRRNGDSQGAQEAIEAMAGAGQWPILREMSTEGAYPQVVTELAAAMPSGRWYGRPLLGDVGTALGCAQKGVPLQPGARSR